MKLKSKKQLIPLFAFLLLIWGSFLAFILYLTHGGLHAGMFAGANLKTMASVYGVAALLLSAFWFVMWWFLHIKDDN